MAKSIKQIQAEAESEGFLDKFDDDNRNDFLESGEAPVLEQRIAELAGAFILAAQKNLQRLGKTDRGELEDSLSVGEIVKIGRASYEVAMGYPDDSDAAEYYDYVDKGVRGVKKQEKAPNSPYTFRSLAVQPVMLDRLEGWVNRNNIASLSEDQPRDLSALQVKRRQVASSVAKLRNRRDITISKERRVAKRIGRAIKWSGLKTSNYLTDALRETFGADFAQIIGRAVSADIRIYLRQVNRNRPR